MQYLGRPVEIIATKSYDLCRAEPVARQQEQHRVIAKLRGSSAGYRPKNPSDICPRHRSRRTCSNPNSGADDPRREIASQPTRCSKESQKDTKRTAPISNGNSRQLCAPTIDHAFDILDSCGGYRTSSRSYGTQEGSCNLYIAMDCNRGHPVVDTTILGVRR
jgi:hypothetical protein